MPQSVVIEPEPNLLVDDFIDVLRRSGLAERRPVDQVERMAAMLANSDLVLTARRGTALVGVSRAITDYQSCCYLADLAVDKAVQRQGIGRRLVAETHRLAGGAQISLILLSAPSAMEYYPRIGLARLEIAFGRLRRS